MLRLAAQAVLQHAQRDAAVIYIPLQQSACYLRTAPELLRWFHFPPPVRATDIVVPSMGDSITEGSVAGILRQSGSSVQEDEAVLQIETDKVTIDVRAPSAGTLRAVVVKEEETVVVGQVVAVLDEEAASVSTKDSAAPTPAQSAPKSAESGLSLEEKTDKAFDKPAHSLRKPSISFPPRRSSDGRVISAMPAVDQTTYVKRSAAQSKAAPPTSPKASALYVAEQPKKRTMSDHEMECINLGGAL